VPADGQEIEEQAQPERVSLFKFFKYLTAWDKVLLAIGSLSAVLAGAILPSISLIMGNVASAFTQPRPGESGGDIIQDMSFIVSYVILIAVSLFIFSYVFYAFWQHLAENIITDLRKRYINALMMQEVAFFEKN
jgi:ATP-binding cassette subfamily B (MDR/TAP) protein 1